LSAGRDAGKDSMTVISAKVPKWVKELIDESGLGKSEVVRAALDLFLSAVLYRSPEPRTFGVMLAFSRALRNRGYRARFCERGCYDSRRSVFYCGDR